MITKMNFYKTLDAIADGGGEPPVAPPIQAAPTIEEIARSARQSGMTKARAEVLDMFNRLVDSETEIDDSEIELLIKEKFGQNANEFKPKILNIISKVKARPQAQTQQSDEIKTSIEQEKAAIEKQYKEIMNKKNREFQEMKAALDLKEKQYAAELREIRVNSELNKIVSGLPELAAADLAIMKYRSTLKDNFKIAEDGTIIPTDATGCELYGERGQKTLEEHFKEFCLTDPSVKALIKPSLNMSKGAGFSANQFSGGSGTLTPEMIRNMTPEEYAKNKQAIFKQLKQAAGKG